MRGGWALSEPLDQRMYRRGLADCEYFAATVRKVARVAATTELLRPLASRCAIENALHAPGHVTAPCDEGRQGNSTRVTAGLGGAERFRSFVARGLGIAPCLAICAPLQTVLGPDQQRFGFAELLRRHLFRSGVARRANGLAGVAHLLNGRAGARREREARDHDKCRHANVESHGDFSIDRSNRNPTPSRPG